MRRLSYNGNTVGYYANNTDLKAKGVTFTATAAGVKMVNGVSGAEYTNVTVGSDKKVTFNTTTSITADIELNDAYQVNGTGIALKDGTSVSNGNYVAAGTEVVVTGSEASGKWAIKAVAGTDVKYGATVNASSSVKATLTYKVEADVTFSEVAMYTVTYNGEEIETAEANTTVTFTSTFASSSTDAVLLVNRDVGTATAGSLAHAGNVVAYQINSSDASSNVIAIVDAYKVTISGNSGSDAVKAGSTPDTVNSTNYVAVGATVTADPDAGRNVASVNTSAGAVTLTSGTLGTADSTIVFKMPAAAVTVTFAA